MELLFLLEDEITVGKHFPSEPLSPRNHYVPILGAIDPMEGSDIAFIAMPPVLTTGFPPFETIGEAVEFFRQFFECLEFMHEYNVFHGDSKYNNIMADTLPLFSSSPHPCRPRMKSDFNPCLSNH